MKTRIVADICCNHQGEVGIAKKMIDTLHECGVKEVKGQKRDLEAHPEWKDKPYDNERSFGLTYYQHRKFLEFDMLQHLQIRDYARSLGMEYFLSVWDAQSLEDVWNAGFTTVKLPSACIADEALLKKAAQVPAAGGQLIISTGMSTVDEIANAYMMCKPQVVLCCTSAYPTPFEDIHLDRMETLGHLCGEADIGISGHWLGIAMDVAAVAMGAMMVERHFTLDRSMKGTDHSASLEPYQIKKIVEDIGRLEVARGSRKLKVHGCEKSARKKLRGT